LSYWSTELLDLQETIELLKLLKIATEFLYIGFVNHRSYAEWTKNQASKY